MKTVFFGASSYVIPIIEYLQNNFDLALVVTTEFAPTDAVVSYCTSNNIPFLSVKKLDELTVEKIRKIEASFAVLADFRLMIRQNVLDIFPYGIINIHPSLLPEYRGPTPGLTAILDGKKESGISLMLLDTELDHGPIIGQINEPVRLNDTSPVLYKRFFEKGTKLLEKVLPEYLSGKIKPAEQNHSNATHTDFLKKDSGFFNSENPPKKDILERMVRAYYPWPGVWTKVNLNGKIKLIKLLPNNMLQVEGKKPLSFKDFLNGYPDMKPWLDKLVI